MTNVQRHKFKRIIAKALEIDEWTAYEIVSKVLWIGSLI